MKIIPIETKTSQPLSVFEKGDIVTSDHDDELQMVTSGENGWDLCQLTGIEAGELRSPFRAELFTLVPFKIEQ